ncbi:hypothetical protein Z517_04683 [Fonsecaea pedrosoi CBS 271.37]|uniref:Unplaced genomic scaffold supercont1.3, whole genome shotgun sequence n=1 Tax=Fonsecaea pedrosoi CBS 271.37 TaxID=1442368 RepID=A0A0D2F4R1_9EURO|nr:uncharacterized protein Z517_04683 [Fonsecaea pedrosoi CBS 271.37]KIW81657.1 hypothetical protein Z517_04683 [Fonsecaea pedrosoi CBS 271.37]
MASEVYRNLTWAKTTRTRWERDIDEAEEFYHVISRVYEGSGRMFFAMTGFISLSVDVGNDIKLEKAEQRVEQALRNAWLHLRYNHPNIASWVEYDGASEKFRKVYEACEEESDQQAWLESTFHKISTSGTGIEWANSDPPAPKLPTLFVIKSDNHESKDGTIYRDIVFRSPHEIIDGIGTLQLLDNLFILASRAYNQQSSYQIPAFGTEVDNLTPPLRVAALIPPSLSAEQQQRLEQILAENAQLRHGVEIACLPFKVGAELPGVHKRVALTYSRQDTQSLLLACKERNITVTHAYHAAIAMALRDLQEKRHENRRVRYISYCLINLRKHCTAPYNTPTHPVSVIHSSSGRSLVVDLEVPPSKEGGRASTKRRNEFTEVVAGVRDFYLSIRDDKEHLSRVPTYWKSGVPRLPESALLSREVFKVPPPDPSPTVSISSMGRIDDIIAPEHGEFKLHDPWVTGEELRSGLGLFLGSWKGQLTLSAAYNDAWHEGGEVLRFLKSCEQIVWQGLGIDCH